jgi:type I restriction enzyme S subunit
VNLPPEASEGTRTQLSEHDVLISITADIGIIGYVDSSLPMPAYINQHIALVRFDQSKVSSKFVSYFLASEKPQKLFRASTDVGAKAGMSLITVQKIQLALPSLPEQCAIAEALSDADALIGALDRLIAKKRDLKQAAMQQLLAGNCGPPSSYGEWETRSMSQVCLNIIDCRGRTPRKLGMEWGGGDILALSARNVRMGHIDFEEETYFGSEALYARWMTNGDVKKGDLVMTTEAPLGNVALIPDDRKYILSQRTILLQLNPKLASAEYLLQLMTSKAFQDRLSENATGSTASGIQRKRFERLEQRLPPVAEQVAIATVLCDMDGEIAVLEQRRDKTHAVKQGMMQELLTGRTRLL